MDIVISILALAGFIVLTASTGLFVAIEFALTGLEKSAVEADVKERGDRRALAVQRDYSNLSFALSGAQLGITVTTLATGFLAEPVLATFFTPVLKLVGLSAESSRTVALIIALIVATTLSMVFGELVPKNWAITDPLRVARFVVPPVNAFNVVFKYFIRAMNAAANFVVRRLGIEPADELASARSPQELSLLVRNSVEGGGIDAATAEVLEASLEFGASNAEELMTPRSTVIFLRQEDTVADLIDVARESGHSRFPVVRGDLDDTIGVVHIKDAFSVPPEERVHSTVEKLARPIPTVPNSLDGDAVLKAVRSAGSQLILVADEYGGTAGIITIEDVVEEIVGEVYDEHDDEVAEREFQQFGTSWEISGLVRLDELQEETGYEAPDGPYETLGGLIMATLGEIPKADDAVLLPQAETTLLSQLTDPPGRWVARVALMDGRRVATAVLTPVSDEEAKEFIR